RAHRSLYWSILRHLEKRVYSGPALVWAPSRGAATEVERRFGRPNGSVSVIPHGVDVGEFSPRERDARRARARSRLLVEDRRVLLLVANDAYTKGVDIAIAA